MKRCKLIAILLVIALVAVLCVACTITEEPQITVMVNGKQRHDKSRYRSSHDRR